MTCNENPYQQYIGCVFSPGGREYTYGIEHGNACVSVGDLVSVYASGQTRVVTVIRTGLVKPSFKVKPAIKVTPYTPYDYRPPRNMTATEVSLLELVEMRVQELRTSLVRELVAAEVKRQLSDLRITAARRD